MLVTMNIIIDTLIGFLFIFVVFAIFALPIITDFLILRKQTTLHDNLIYTTLKTVIYITFLFLPIFIIHILKFIYIVNPNASWDDNTSIYFLNHYTVDYTLWLLFIGGMAVLLFAKSIALQYLDIKQNVLLLLDEVFYAPFLFITVFLALW